MNNCAEKKSEKSENSSESKEQETCGICTKPCGNEWCVTKDVHED